MSGERILVVDDNPANLRLATFVLAKGGYIVETATDAEMTFAAVARALPALVLLDLQLPGIDGFEIARRLKRDERTRGIPIIAVTAFAMSGDEARARAAGCDGYVAKPIDTRALPETVAAFIAAHSVPTEEFRR